MLDPTRSKIKQCLRFYVDHNMKSMHGAHRCGEHHEVRAALPGQRQRLFSEDLPDHRDPRPRKTIRTIRICLLLCCYCYFCCLFYLIVFLFKQLTYVCITVALQQSNRKRPFECTEQQETECAPRTPSNSGFGGLAIVRSCLFEGWGSPRRRAADATRRGREGSWGGWTRVGSSSPGGRIP